MAQLLEFEKIRRICNRLIDRLETEYGSEVDLEKTPMLIAEYWEFDLETAFTCAEKPVMQAGDFRNDIDEIGEVLARTDEEIFLWHDLDHLAGVLRGIAFMDLGAHSSRT